MNIRIITTEEFKNALENEKAAIENKKIAAKMRTKKWKSAHSKEQHQSWRTDFQGYYGINWEKIFSGIGRKKQTEW